MASHTPGPWKIGMRPGPIIYNADGVTQIADMCESLNSRDENIANARLIAAAPELLAALETLLAEHIGYAGDGSEDHCCRVCNMARAAIRKARGE